MQLSFFALNGLFAGIVYSVAVWSLISISPETIELDVIVAFALSALANYLGARLVFRPETTIRGHALRYLTVIVANFLTAGFFAWCLHRAGADDIVSVYLPVLVTAGPTFVLMRSWAFKKPDSGTFRS